jgi:hypothetical protein
LFTPVRTSQDSVGVLVASISPERLLSHELLVTGDVLAYSVATDSGAVVYRWGEPAAKVPPEMSLEMTLPPLFGTMWTVRYAPTHVYLNGVESRWPTRLDGLLRRWLRHRASS